jgi:DNA-binding transcriptional regulator LsrR (DeoR family)
VLENRELLYTIANLYYEKGKNQQEISNLLNLSRPMVSRALSRSRAKGIVRIEVIPPAGCSQLETDLAKALGIKRVVVGTNFDRNNNDRDDRIKVMSRAAGSYLSQTIQNGMVVGVGWGVSVHRSILALPECENLKGVTVVPLVGSAGRTESHYQVNVIADRMAEKLHGNALFFNIPAFVSDLKVQSFFSRDPQMKSIQELWSHLDIAIVGLGAFGGTPSFPVSEYTPQALDELHQQQVVGDILGRFYNREGFIDDIGVNERLITRPMPDVEEKLYVGIPFDSLRKAKQVVCICGGTGKIEGIMTAAKLHLFDCLITDGLTANELTTALERSR